MELQTQIYGSDERTATAQTHQPPSQNPGWIDYPHAEKMLFDALRPELELTALDYGHHFGEDVGDMVDEVAETVYPKAMGILNQHGHGRVFAERHLFAKVKEWTKFHCDRQRRREKFKREETAAAAISHSNQLGHNLRKFGGWIGFALGNTGSAIKQAKAADNRARQAQMLRATGKKLAEIAEILGVKIRTVSRYLIRKIGALVAKLEAGLKSWTTRKGWSGTDPSNFDTGSRTAFARCPTGPEAPPKSRDPAKIDADPAALGALGALCTVLRQRLSQVLLA